MSRAMAGDFSETEANRASTNLLRGRILQSGGVPTEGSAAGCWLMTSLPETPEEIAARQQAILAEQRTMLEHLTEWIRLRDLKQKDVAAALGVSEATVSSWIAGKQRMSVGQLQQIAFLLKAEVGDLLRAPDARDLSNKVQEALTLMDQLNDNEWEAVMQNARMIAAAKARA